MSIATDTKVANLEAENRMLKAGLAENRAGLEAAIERIEVLEGLAPPNNNAVVEGDEIEPKATRNGKLRKSR